MFTNEQHPLRWKILFYSCDADHNQNSIVKFSVI